MKGVHVQVKSQRSAEEVRMKPWLKEFIEVKAAK